MASTIALDAMGGDHGSAVTVPAAVAFLESRRDDRIILVGHADQIDPLLSDVPGDVRDRCEVRHAAQVVAMDESPAKALRGKRESSMRLALEAVKSGDADACVSAGNTGALMAMARFVLKTLPAIDRPAITRPLPTLRGLTYMLDLGANLECTPEQLLQFGVMGAVLAQSVGGLERPSVGLLNIGSEDIKGTDLIQRSAALLQAAEINYFGYVEGNDIYLGTTDVVVCDGFVGNVSLKTGEGLARMISEYLKRHYKQNWYSRFAALVSAPVLRGFQADIDHRKYNGASLLGLSGTVIKSHGSSDVFATTSALKEAAVQALAEVPRRIDESLQSLLKPSRVA